MAEEIKAGQLNLDIFRFELDRFRNYLPTYNKQSLSKADRVFKLMKDIESIDKLDDIKAIWLHTLQSKPEWYKLTTVESPKYQYRSIFLNEKQIFESDGKKESNNWEVYDITELLDWLISALNRSLSLLHSGKYDSYVKRRLPLDLRTGTLKRNDLWALFPEWKDNLYENFPDSEQQKFLSYAKREINTFVHKRYSISPLDRIPSMTANDFYKYCSIGYLANNYEGTDLPPKEQYIKHADGRDEGLRDINPDSPSAFLNWLEDKSHFGGHPWEICRGGNSTHINLAPIHDEKGYYLYLCGSSISRTIETLKIYNALNDNNLPVVLSDVKILYNRITGDENIGIVPRTIFPRYCQTMFPEGEVIDFMHLPTEKRRKVAKKCTWHEERKVKLKGQN